MKTNSSSSQNRVQIDEADSQEFPSMSRYTSWPSKQPLLRSSTFKPSLCRDLLEKSDIFVNRLVLVIVINLVLLTAGLPVLCPLQHTPLDTECLIIHRY